MLYAPTFYSQLTGADIIELPPLTRAESEAAISEMLVAPGPFRVSQIAEYAGGNPLYIEELCHGLPGHGGAPNGLICIGQRLGALIPGVMARRELR